MINMTLRVIFSVLPQAYCESLSWANDLSCAGVLHQVLLNKEQYLGKLFTVQSEILLELFAIQLQLSDQVMIRPILTSV